MKHSWLLSECISVFYFVHLFTKTDMILNILKISWEEKILEHFVIEHLTPNIIEK